MRNLVFVIDEKNDYSRHLGVTLASTLKNSNVKWKIFIIHLTLLDENKKRLKEIADKYDSEIKFIGLKDEDFSLLKMREDTYISKVTYARLMVPELLKEESKGLYLDCDMVVLKPLEALYDKDLEEFSIGAIPDGKYDQTSSKKRLGLNEKIEYFNAGLLLMDLDRLRENKKFDEVLEFAKTTKDNLELFDQDALNMIFQGNYKILPEIYNVTHGVLLEKEYSFSKIGVIHYTGSVKPWDARCLHKFRKAYLEYLEYTPWKGYKLDNQSILNTIKRELTFFKLSTRNLRYKIKNLK